MFINKKKMNHPKLNEILKNRKIKQSYLIV